MLESSDWLVWSAMAATGGAIFILGMMAGHRVAEMTHAAELTYLKDRHSRLRGGYVPDGAEQVSGGV